MRAPSRSFSPPLPGPASERRTCRAARTRTTLFVVRDPSAPELLARRKQHARWGLGNPAASVGWALLCRRPFNVVVTFATRNIPRGRGVARRRKSKDVRTRSVHTPLLYVCDQVIAFCMRQLHSLGQAYIVKPKNHRLRECAGVRRSRDVANPLPEAHIMRTTTAYFWQTFQVLQLGVVLLFMAMPYTAHRTSSHQPLLLLEPEQDRLAPRNAAP